MGITSFLLLLIAILLNAGAQLLLKAGASHLGHFAFSWANLFPIGLRAASNPYIFAGLSCYVISVGIWIMVLSRVEVSVAYPMISLGYIVTAVSAYYLFQEPLTLVRMMGIAVILCGVFLITRSA